MMIFLRTRRGVDRVQLRSLSDAEVADNLAPMHSGHVEVAPLDSPLAEPREHPDGSIDPDERSQWAQNLP